MREKRTSPVTGMYRRHQCLAIPFVTAILRQLEGEVPKMCLESLLNKDFSGYVSMTTDPSAFTDASEFRDAYLATEILSKFPSWDLGISRSDVALSKFGHSELSCLETNKRLRALYGTASTTVSVSSVIYTASRKIQRVLGPFSWDEASQFFAFGPGASFALKRKYGDAYHKFGCIPEVTRSCAALGCAVLLAHPGWLSHLSSLSGSSDPLNNLKIVEGNRITTVPKNAKTDRVIAIEPLMNMFIQKGIGRVIRHRLRRIGINLDDQTINQRYAEEGSRTGRLATIDLSSASDTVSLELCRQLLPSDWFCAIEQARSQSGVFPSGERIAYQKVSSMGNGFTFELESLIFWALVSSVVDLLKLEDRRVSVYGDDIIVSVDAYGRVREILEFCGFTVNEKKSFWQGPFRESCGKHYFMGLDVTPFYIREDMETPDRVILALNNLRRFAARLQPYGLDGRFQQVYDEFRQYLPPWFRKPRIPDGYGDGALFGDFSEVCPRRAPLGHDGWVFQTCSDVSSTWTPSDYPLLLKSLYGMERRQGNGGDRSMLPVKKEAFRPRYKLQKSVATQWIEKGEWI